MKNKNEWKKICLTNVRLLARACLCVRIHFSKKWLADSDNIKWNVYIFICFIWNAISIDVKQSTEPHRMLFTWKLTLFNAHAHTRIDEKTQIIPVKRLLPYRTCHGTNKCRVSLICLRWLSTPFFSFSFGWCSSKNAQSFMAFMVYGPLSPLPSFILHFLTASDWMASVV